MKHLGFSLIIALFIAISYSCKNSTDLTSAVPSTAMTVIHIDTKSLLSKADYKPLENKVLKEMLEKQKSNLSGDNLKSIEQFEKFLKDPNSIGIDLVNDCVIYMDSATMGIIWKMNDSKKFKDLLVNTAKMPEQMLTEEDGVTIVSPQQSVCVGWTKDKLLILTNYSSAYKDYSLHSPNLSALVKKQLKQTSEESINSNKAFTDFIAEKKDISVFYSYDNAMGIWNTTLDRDSNMFGDSLAVGMSDVLGKVKDQLKGVSAGAFVSFEKGEIAFNNKMYYDSPEAEKKFADLASRLNGELKGDQLKYITENPFFLASTNLKGEGFYDYLAQLGIISLFEKSAGSNLSEMGIDLKSFISNLNGDITLAFNQAKKDGTFNFQYTFMADLKDASSTWNLIKAKIKELDAEEYNPVEINPNTYSFYIPDFIEYHKYNTTYTGINNNTFFFTNSEEVYKNLSATDLKNDLASQAKGKAAFIYGNLNSLKQLALDKNYNDAKTIEFLTKGFDLVGGYSYTSTSDMKGNGKIVITDTGANSLAVICKFIDSIITAYAENM
jgi:hypothetical protein